MGTVWASHIIYLGVWGRHCFATDRSWVNASNMQWKICAYGDDNDEISKTEEGTPETFFGKYDYSNFVNERRSKPNVLLKDGTFVVGYKSTLLSHTRIFGRPFVYERNKSVEGLKLTRPNLCAPTQLIASGNENWSPTDLKPLRKLTQLL